MLKNPFIGSGFGTLIILVIIILDHKYNNNTRTNKQYLRITIMVYGTLFGLIYFVYNEKSLGKQIGGSNTVKGVESMLIGRPDF